VQVIASIDEYRLNLPLLNGSCADLQGSAELPLDFPETAQIAADAAYTEYNWEDYLLEKSKINLLVSRKKNTKRVDLPAMKDYKFWLRHPIETTIGEIEKVFPKKMHATTLSGFILKIALFLWAFQVDKAFIQ
jgi:hypothetical protein